MLELEDKPSTDRVIAIRLLEGQALESQIPRLEEFVLNSSLVSLSRHPAWLMVMRDGIQHTPYCLEAVRDGETCGLLPLAYVQSLLFGRFLVSLPYLNVGGVVATDPSAASVLIDGAVRLADSLKVRHLELRQEEPLEHAALLHRSCAKVHMRLSLPGTEALLWNQLDSKVRNQIRKGQKCGLSIDWGGRALLDEFFAVFSHNMRDLGTPTFGKRLFASIIERFPNRVEFCVVRADGKAVASAVLLHGWGVSEVPSASSLRKFNHTCANMLMYWELLARTVKRRQQIFDFGRASPDSATHRFKKQWGASEAPAAWQYYMRQGSATDMRPENPRFQQLIRIWRRLPVSVTRLIGPRIVRGIP